MCLLRELALASPMVSWADCGFENHFGPFYKRSLQMKSPVCNLPLFLSLHVYAVTLTKAQSYAAVLTLFLCSEYCICNRACRSVCSRGLWWGEITLLTNQECSLFLPHLLRSLIYSLCLLFYDLFPSAFISGSYSVLYWLQWQFFPHVIRLFFTALHVFLFSSS